MAIMRYLPLATTKEGEAHYVSALLHRVATGRGDNLLHISGSFRTADVRRESPLPRRPMAILPRYPESSRQRNIHRNAILDYIHV